jgi:hypothetical protein
MAILTVLFIHIGYAHSSATLAVQSLYPNKTNQRLAYYTVAPIELPSAATVLTDGGSHGTDRYAVNIRSI